MCLGCLPCPQAVYQSIDSWNLPTNHQSQYSYPILRYVEMYRRMIRAEEEMEVQKSEHILPKSHNDYTGEQDSDSLPGITPQSALPSHRVWHWEARGRGSLRVDLDWCNVCEPQQRCRWPRPGSIPLTTLPAQGLCNGEKTRLFFFFKSTLDSTYNFFITRCSETYLTYVM